MINDRRINVNEFSYEELIKLREHSMQYQNVSDKRTFLKTMIPFEQKLVLLNSYKPYEVLSFLESLDYKNTDLIIDSLTNDELRKIINLFTMEDKQRFYNNFSHLDLVNRFIAHDKNSKEYVEKLTIDRKVDLLNETDNKTLESVETIYSTMSSEEKQIANEKVTLFDIGNLTYNSNENNIDTAHIDDSKTIEDNIIIKDGEISQEIKQESEEQINELEDSLAKFDPYSEIFDINNIPELTKDKLVSNPIEQKIEIKSIIPEIETPEEILAKFTKVVQETEKKEIEIIKSNIVSKGIELPKSVVPNILPTSLDFLNEKQKLK